MYFCCLTFAIFQNYCDWCLLIGCVGLCYIFLRFLREFNEKKFGYKLNIPKYLFNQLNLQFEKK